MTILEVLRATTLEDIYAAYEAEIEIEDEAREILMETTRPRRKGDGYICGLRMSDILMGIALALMVIERSKA